MDTSVSIHTAIYRDDLETMKWHLSQKNCKINKQNLLIFAAEVGSYECFRYIHKKYMKKNELVYVILPINAINGGDPRILDLIMKTGLHGSLDVMLSRAVALDRKKILDWMIAEKYASERMIANIRKYKDLIIRDIIRNDADLHIHRPRIVEDLWEMENTEYTQYIQWLPREVLGDFVNLWINELVNSGQ